VYIFGGEDQNGDLYDEHFVLEFSDRPNETRWKAMAVLESKKSKIQGKNFQRKFFEQKFKRAKFAMTETVNNEYYIYGGTDSTQICNDLCKLEVKNSEFFVFEKIQTKGERPPASQNSILFHHQNMLFSFLGKSKNFFSTTSKIFCLNLTTMLWRAVKTDLPEMGQLEGVGNVRISDNRIFVIFPLCF
jgi:hypothetical protein